MIRLLSTFRWNYFTYQECSTIFIYSNGKRIVYVLGLTSPCFGHLTYCPPKKETHQQFLDCPFPHVFTFLITYIELVEKWVLDKLLKQAWNITNDLNQHQDSFQLGWFGFDIYQFVMCMILLYSGRWLQNPNLTPEFHS